MKMRDLIAQHRKLVQKTTGAFFPGDPPLRSSGHQRPAWAKVGHLRIEMLKLFQDKFPPLRHKGHGTPPADRGVNIVPAQFM